MRKRACVALALALLAWSVAWAQEDSRYALVIGNAAYGDSIGRLENPVNDANDMTAALSELGFKVMLLTDGDQRTMREGVRSFAQLIKASPGAVSFVFYAGHGIQYHGENYLVPTDADIKDPEDLAYAALNAQWVLDVIGEADPALSIFIVDACRNFPRNWSRGGVSRGLAVMSVNIPQSIVMYATGANMEASDNPTGHNGLFTAELLKYLRMPELDVDQVFKKTMAGVSKASDGEQVPYIYTNFTGTARLAYKNAVPPDTPPGPPKTRDEYIAMGKYLVSKRQFSLAAEYFTEVINLDPSYDPPYLLRGMALLASVCDLSHANMSSSDYVPNIGYHGEIAISDEKILARAIEDLRRATPIAKASYYLGLAYVCQWQDPSAIDCFTTVVNLDPTHFESYCMRGFAYHRLQQYGNAILDLDSALCLSPYCPYALKLRGDAYASGEKQDLAIKDYDEAITYMFAYPEEMQFFPKVYYSRGFAYHHQSSGDAENIKKALADFTVTINLDPKCAEAYFNRGIIYYFNTRRYDLAFPDIEKAIQLDPDNKNYRDIMKYLLEKMKK
jgi:tetratricopeptide (TPR) repeat protein